MGGYKGVFIKYGRQNGELGQIKEFFFNFYNFNYVEFKKDKYVIQT